MHGALDIVLVGHRRAEHDHKLTALIAKVDLVQVAAVALHHVHHLGHVGLEPRVGGGVGVEVEAVEANKERGDGAVLVHEADLVAGKAPRDGRVDEGGEGGQQRSGQRGQRGQRAERRARGECLGHHEAAALGADRQPVEQGEQIGMEQHFASAGVVLGLGGAVEGGAGQHALEAQGGVADDGRKHGAVGEADLDRQAEAAGPGANGGVGQHQGLHRQGALHGAGGCAGVIGRKDHRHRVAAKRADYAAVSGDQVDHHGEVVVHEDGELLGARLAQARKGLAYGREAGDIGEEHHGLQAARPGGRRLVGVQQQIGGDQVGEKRKQRTHRDTNCRGGATTAYQQTGF